MSAADKSSSKNLFALTLKGQVTIHFIDGTTLDGEFVAQDELNIFLKVDDAPLMIPRSQVRYIKGKQGQSLERDEALAAMLETNAGATPPAPPKADALSPSVDTLRDTSQTGQPVAPSMPSAEVTSIPVTKTVEDVVLKPQDVGLIFEDDEDPTLVLKQEPTQPAEEDSTLVIEIEKTELEKISGHLDCTTGPHAGETFELVMGVTTLGRASDNIVGLPNDKEISRKHSKILYESGHFIIEDQNSLNGTFVNDERIDSPRYLEDGDQILIGVSTLVYHQK